MKKSFRKNNKGFSLIELIVIIAIMSIAGGATILSVSLATGSEARKAYKAIDAELNETKTGSMARYGEVLELKYQFKGTPNTASGVDMFAVDEQAADGFYALKKSYTLAQSTTSGQAVEQKLIGQESRMLSNGRVEIILWYGDSKPTSPDDRYTSLTPYKLKDDASNSISFEYRREDGLLKEVIASDIGEVTPQYLECKSGNRSYMMEFIPGTGKHKQVE